MLMALDALPALCRVLPPCLLVSLGSAGRCRGQCHTKHLAMLSQELSKVWCRMHTGAHYICSSSSSHTPLLPHRGCVSSGWVLYRMMGLCINPSSSSTSSSSPGTLQHIPSRTVPSRSGEGSRAAHTGMAAHTCQAPFISSSSLQGEVMPGLVGKS